MIITVLFLFILLLFIIIIIIIIIMQGRYANRIPTLAAPMLMRGVYMVLLVSAAPEGQLAISS